MAVTNIALELFGVTITVLLLLCCFIEAPAPKRQTGLFAAMLSVNILVLLCDALTWAFEEQPQYTALLYTLNFFVYCLGYVLTALFTHYLVSYISAKEKASRLITIIIDALCLVASLLVAVSLFNHMYFSFDDGVYLRGPLYWLSQVYPIAIILADMIIVLRHRRALGVHDTVSFLSYGALPIIAMLVQIWVFGITLLYIATTCSLLIIYIMIHVDQSRRMERQNAELAQANIAIMLSQIQPHFLYNSLNTVDALCDIDTKAAQKAVRSFAKYLRGNLDSLSRKTPVPFRDELAHLRQYLTLETYRFDNIRIDYDLEAMDFMLPPLTLQPIVENAVKYGVLKRRDGGTITISTRNKRDHFLLTVADDGVGFNMRETPDRSRSHVGIANVRNRLETMCGGTLTVESVPDVGTIVTYIIPKGGPA